MKKLFTSILFSFFVTLLAAQNFEGLIVYKLEYQSKLPVVSNEQLKQMLGEKQLYYYKNGSYKSESDGKMMEWQLYVEADNKLYSKMTNSQTLYFLDVTQNSDSVVAITRTGNTQEIVGLTCQEVVVKTKTGQNSYYFNEYTQIDKGKFEQHHLGNWSAYVKNTGALPLKMVIETEQFILYATAEKVEKKELPTSMFYLDSKATTAPMPVR